MIVSLRFVNKGQGYRYVEVDDLYVEDSGITGYLSKGKEDVEVFKHKKEEIREVRLHDGTPGGHVVVSISA